MTKRLFGKSKLRDMFKFLTAIKVMFRELAGILK